MRIIAGFFKGRKILEPNDSNTRPLKDLTKESIFNIIKHSNKFDINLEKSNILDLFSGVGSFGIECLSRGAKNVIFVENYDKALKILRKNLDSLNSFDNFKIIENDINKINFFSNLQEKFNIVFLDPPYKDKNLENLLNKIYKSKILYKKSVIIIHRHKNEKDNFPKQFKVIEEKKYGISKIIFLSILD
jgi:16S rRNA (guanine966-N2)-methyltransferase